MKLPVFLNVDLEIESRKPLRPLARELRDKIHMTFLGRINGNHCLFFEISANTRNQEATIHAFCKLIEGLSAVNRKLWDTALRKEFDLGYESQLSSERANRFTIRPSAVRRVANLGASLAITFYQQDDQPRKPTRSLLACLKRRKRKR
jgi:hypothetical protein